MNFYLWFSSSKVISSLGALTTIILTINPICIRNHPVCDFGTYVFSLVCHFDCIPLPILYFLVFCADL